MVKYRKRTNLILTEKVENHRGADSNNADRLGNIYSYVDVVFLFLRRSVLAPQTRPVTDGVFRAHGQIPYAKVRTEKKREVYVCLKKSTKHCAMPVSARVTC